MSRFAIRWARWFPALDDPRVRLYLGGQTVSVLGTWVLDITLNLLTWELTKSPATLGTLNFLLAAPGVLITPLFAARLTAQNARRRTLAVLWAAVAVALALALLTLLQRLTLPALFVLAAARGVLSGMEMPSRQMLLASSVERREHIAGAVALNTVVFQVARMVGPAVAALLFAGVGALWGFVLAALALSYMVRCVQRFGGPVAAEPAAPEPGARVGLLGALAFVRADRFGRLFMPATVGIALFGGGYQTLIPVLADRVFGDTASWTSAFFAAVGGGALSAALLVSSHHRVGAQRRLMVPLPWLTALALAGLAASTSPAPTLACFALLGFGITFVSTSTNGLLHERVPPPVRGGLIALYLAAFIGVMTLGQLLAGTLAQWLPVRAAFGVLAAGLCAALLAVFGLRWRALGRIEMDAERI